MQHREHVDRVLALVDAVIWVVDPEKYADAVLHERYLRPLAGHAEVMFVVLNQVDRLPGEAADLVLDDLRRLLDEDGIALGEHGEPGATVLALSALTGEGVGELRELLGQFVRERGAAARRIAADVDAGGRAAAAGVRPAGAASARAIGRARRRATSSRTGSPRRSARPRPGEAAERAWRGNAGRACGTPWLRLWRWYEAQRSAYPGLARPAAAAPADEESTARAAGGAGRADGRRRGGAGLPAPWAQAVRESAVRGAEGLPEALDELAAAGGAAGPGGRRGPRGGRPRCWRRRP